MDTGSLINILPLHVLQEFEYETSFLCKRFINNRKFAAHCNTTLDILEYGVELPLIFTCVNGEQKPCLLPFFIERTSSPQGILGINAISNIDIHVGTSYNFFRISKTFESVIPSSPISLNINNGSGKIQGISLSNGIYSFATRGNQTFHEPGCVHAHDPRLKCLRPLTKFHSYFGIVLPSLLSDEGR